VLVLTEDNLARLSQFVFERSGGGIPNPRGASEAERNAAALHMAVSRVVAGLNGRAVRQRFGSAAPAGLYAATDEQAEVLWELLQSVAATWIDHPDHPDHAQHAEYLATTARASGEPMTEPPR
jgi:hypothetical protein